MPVDLIAVTPGVIFEAPAFTVSAFSVNHRGPDNYGYLFEEKGRQPFLVEAADALGVPAGPLRGRLVSGQSITLADGRVVTPDMVTGAFKPGARLAALGDLGETASLTELLRGVDGLVMEATYLQEEANMALQYAHLTARQAGEFAAHIGAGKLMLTHLSRRYRDKDILAEAQSAFENTSVARDFDTFTIRKEA